MRTCFGWILVGLAIAVAAPGALAAPRADVANTKHNLSSIGPAGRDVVSTNESQICVFCHTPHAATAIPEAPLWNRALSGATYTMYDNSVSESIDFTAASDSPGGSSKLCLSCHDGTLAIGNVNVSNGQANPVINMTGTAVDGSMPPGSGTQTGFTRDLGVNLTNDHPISFTYDSALVAADGELRDPTGHIGTRVAGVRPPQIPLESYQEGAGVVTNRVECISCHDPHVTDDALSVSNKFLRLNRFQAVEPTSGAFQSGNDIICLGCHDKDSTDFPGSAWSESAHARDDLVGVSTDAGDETYQTTPAALREFPDGLPVWQAACLNCHDTHTVQGARRLLREGTDSGTTPKSGGNSAIEETCYQCHTTNAATILNTAGATDNNHVPNIETDFGLNRRMPIAQTPETHEISNADLIETQARLGKVSAGGTLGNRHVECTDCHNPHRVLKNQRFTGDGGTNEGTHLHAAGTQHSNIASGVLRGTWGVEPQFTATGPTSWPALISTFTVKQGDRGSSTSTDRSQPYLTREYQLCFKCHSNYAYDDNNTFTGTQEGSASGRPPLGYPGGTPQGTNGLDYYTNQVTEFNVGANDTLTGSDQGERGIDGAPEPDLVNHRSWHPVVYPTGRTLAERGGMNNHWTSPWNGGGGSYIGNLTMYCSDCHGSTTNNGTSTPTGRNPWGPHGSNDDFILKGDWSPAPANGTGAGQQDDLCFKCHSYTTYATDSGGRSGFCCDSNGTGDTNLHGTHAKLIDTGTRCMYCHVAVPHGWKNKALLVNLNDVGPEAGLTAGTSVSPDRYTRAPYYQNAFLRIVNWKRSGQWQENDCGRPGDTGKNWMRSVCQDVN